MKYILKDLLDFDKVNLLLEGFNKATGSVISILDLEGNILSKSGWKTICTDFHRVNPETAEKCVHSNTVLAGAIADGKKYSSYKCPNGLFDVAVPIIINGEHYGNLFSGQFFFEEPDREFFRKQALKYGFDEKTYIDALEKVPIIPESQVNNTMNFVSYMTDLICEMSLQKIEQLELNKALKESEEKFQDMIMNLVEGFYSVTLDGKLLFYSAEFTKILGLDSKKDYTGIDLPNFWQNPDDREAYIAEFMTKGYIKNYEVNAKKFSGEKLVVRASSRLIKNNDGMPLRIEGTFLDITEQKKIEEELKKHREQLEELVIERTRELEEKNKVLDNTLKVFVGREQKIKDLEKRISLMVGK